jgi:hypothetical protein
MIDMIVERPTLRLTLTTLHDHHLPAAVSVTEGALTASSNGQVDPPGPQPESQPQPLRETAASGSGRR